MEDNMEEKEKELILKAVDGNKRVRFLYEEHTRLKELLQDFESRSFLTEQEQQEVKKIKVKKLKGKEEMIKLAYKCAEGF